MGMLVIIIVLVVLWAHKSGRPMKLVLTPEEAIAVKARWWASARAELKAWAIVFVLGYAVAGESLASAHWHWPIYAMIVLGSLQLFSRLAIWGTLVLWAVVWVAGSAAELLGHRLFSPLYIMVPLMGAIFAILLRFFFTFWRRTSLAQTPVQPASVQKGKFFVPSFDDPVYDHETDTRDEDRPENVRRRRDEDDYYEWKRAEDDYFERKRAEDQRRAENDYFEPKRKDDDYFDRLR
jgi:hypothetical protein